MPTWIELETRFLELEPSLRSSRLDRQTGVAGEYWRIAASFDRLASSRFEALSRIAGRKLLEQAGGEEALSGELKAAPSDDIRWYRALVTCTGFYEHGFTGYQTDEQGNYTGAILSGHLPNPAGVAAAYCLELSAMTTEPSDPKGAVTINVSGVNARVNLSSTDNSTNTYSASTSTVFENLRSTILQQVPPEAQPALLDRVEQLQLSVGKPTFTARYSEFVQQAANHITILAPFLPALTALLPS
jgi:hypothetical protein